MMNSSIKSLLSKAPSIVKPQIRCIPPPTTTTKVELPTLPLAQTKLPCKTAREFNQIPKTVSYHSLYYIPQQHTDIKGVDALVHRLLQQKFSSSKQYSPMVSSEFMNVHFFPRDHMVSQFRKSNVSLVMTHYRTPKYNDGAIERAMDKYKGKYASLQEMEQETKPGRSACGRSRLRRMFRMLLVQAFKDVGEMKETEIGRVAGTYFCTIRKVPITEQQKEKVINEFKYMISKLMSVKDVGAVARAKVDGTLVGQYKELLRSVKVNCDVGRYKSDRIKFPFFDARKAQQIIEGLRAPLGSNYKRNNYGGRGAGGDRSNYGDKWAGGNRNTPRQEPPRRHTR
ncbi:hypothetical protein Cantr_05580 [Candida viswanathii]|uniref:Uncharacterized protein n=1 Tax=Candida viswanathii TaxID=5486 RepID=A0A367XS76_9ASCO|nr:hypothetical protein Cantr_05580 [Candida viswanathii]